MSITGGSDGGEMTLAFSLAAIQRLADPKAALEDARRWSRHVGVVDHDRGGVERVVEADDLPQDYDLGELDIWLALEGIRDDADTARYVYVATTEDDRRPADFLDWEFQLVGDAAERAGWPLVEDETA
ncbi:hypothetical protein GCM10009037_22150 [Halarchaeum grantii]|uniref:DUF7124 domain-containing protein n=1 Tax=Halarchaeum grantii TaxID=1193105 RepID=A0A830EWN9_9EURY|nr:hypothetical protein [Halarchaeum grantii]GGL38131.1 hypothetical protein GCM10009037_22150 [Halarchaeum grantii]